MWSGAFQEPTDYRKAKRAGSCAIEGNISANGDKIYHMPGTRNYDRTRIREKSGECMFCTEAEARAAGGGRLAGSQQGWCIAQSGRFDPPTRRSPSFGGRHNSKGTLVYAVAWVAC